jgi:hypothetical protein
VAWVKADLDAAALTAHYQALGPEEQWRLQQSASVPVGDPTAYTGYVTTCAVEALYRALGLFPGVAPLRRGAGGVAHFLHRSFFEFFAARHLLSAAGGHALLDIRVERSVAALDLQSRRVQDEAEVRFHVACSVRAAVLPLA